MFQIHVESSQILRIFCILSVDQYQERTIFGTLLNWNKTLDPQSNINEMIWTMPPFKMNIY